MRGSKSSWKSTSQMTEINGNKRSKKMTLKKDVERNFMVAYEMDYGRIAVVEDPSMGSHNGRLITKVRGGYAPIPQSSRGDCWGPDCGLMVRVLPEGTECVV